MQSFQPTLLCSDSAFTLPASLQFGEPIYPPAFVSFQAGPAPWSLAPPSLKFPVAASGALWGRTGTQRIRCRPVVQAGCALCVWSTCAPHPQIPRGSLRCKAQWGRGVLHTSRASCGMGGWYLKVKKALLCCLCINLLSLLSSCPQRRCSASPCPRTCPWGATFASTCTASGSGSWKICRWAIAACFEHQLDQLRREARVALGQMQTGTTFPLLVITQYNNRLSCHCWPSTSHFTIPTTPPPPPSFHAVVPCNTAG